MLLNSLYFRYVYLIQANKNRTREMIKRIKDKTNLNSGFIKKQLLSKNSDFIKYTDRRPKVKKEKPPKQVAPHRQNQY
jgi:hypothetical protein